MTLEEFATETNMDLETTVARFGGSEGLLIRFLKKFIEDKTYGELENAVEQEDYPTIERAAHTLKGVSANLGLEEIREKSDHIVSAVRSQSYDKIPGFFQELEESYKNTIESLNCMI